MTRRTPRRKHALRGLEVGPYLHTVDWRQCVDSFEFDYETARDEEIHATLPDDMALVVKRYRNLSLERHALQAQLYPRKPVRRPTRGIPDQAGDGPRQRTERRERHIGPARRPVLWRSWRPGVSHLLVFGRPRTKLRVK